LRTFDSSVITTWPPLFSSLLASLALVLHADVFWIGGFVNALAFGLIVYLSGRLFFSGLRETPLLAIVGLLCVLVYPLPTIAVMVWSEPLFIVFELVFVLALAAYWKRSTAPLFVLLASVAALASLQRYIGVTLIVLGVIALLFDARERSGRRRLCAALFGAAASVPVVLWMARNLSVDGTLVGPRSPSPVSLLTAIRYAAAGMISWLLPADFAYDHPTASTGLFALLCCAVVIAFAAPSVRRRAGFPYALGSAALSAVYILWLVVSAATTAFDPIDIRFLSPIFPFAVLTFLFLVQTLLLACLTYVREKEGRLQLGKYSVYLCQPVPAVTLLAAGVFLIWFIYPAGELLRFSNATVRDGRDLNHSAWHNSELVQNLRRGIILPQCQVVYSNYPEVVYFYAEEGKWQPRYSPLRSPPRVMSGNMQFQALDSQWPEAGACLIWKDTTERADLLRPDELAALRHLVLLAQFQDGAIYSIGRQ